MTASYTVNGGNVTVDFKYTAAIKTVQDTATSAAKYMYYNPMDIQNEGETPDFNTLTDQQKLDIIDAYLLKVIQQAARLQYTVDAEKAARTQAVSDAKSKFF